MNETKDRMKSGFDVADRDRGQNISGQAAGIAQDAKNAAGKAASAVKEQAGAMADKVADLAGGAKEKVQEWSSEAAEMAKHAGESVQKWAGDAYDSTADTVKTFGTEVSGLVKKYPIQSVIVGFGVGMLLGRAARV